VAVRTKYATGTRIVSEALKASPIDGMVEYDGSHVYMTVGGSRQQLDRQMTCQQVTASSSIGYAPYEFTTVSDMSLTLVEGTYEIYFTGSLGLEYDGVPDDPQWAYVALYFGNGPTLTNTLIEEDGFLGRKITTSVPHNLSINDIVNVSCYGVGRYVYIIGSWRVVEILSPYKYRINSRLNTPSGSSYGTTTKVLVLPQSLVSVVPPESRHRQDVFSNFVDGVNPFISSTRVTISGTQTVYGCWTSNLSKDFDENLIPTWGHRMSCDTECMRGTYLTDRSLIALKIY
jgi:hypothetical protein